MARPLLTLFVFIVCAGCARSGPYVYRQIAMGVEAKIALYAPSEGQARRAAQGAFERIAELEQVMSDYRPQSELMTLVRTGTPGAWTPVGEDLHRVLAESVRIADLTNGAFDPTVGPVVRPWREARRSGVRPDESALARAMTAVGFEALVVDPDEQRVRLGVPAMSLDLGGIGKGFAADEAGLMLRRAGIDRFLIDFGGDTLAGAPPPGMRGWRIDTLRRDEVYVLADAAVATSGNQAQFVEIEGVRYGHVIDPRTGRPTTHERLVTVVAPTAALADALASAAMVLDADEGAIIEERFPNARVRVITLDQRLDTRR